MSAKTTARLNLSIPEPQRVFLHAEAERLGISVGELMRQIIDECRAASGPGRIVSTSPVLIPKT